MRTSLIRLDVGSTKNDDGGEVTMTKTIRELVRQAVAGKNPDDYLLTRADGAPVKDFRQGWKKLCEKAGLDGLHIHDFRRSAAREPRKAGVPESTIMGHWRLENQRDVQTLRHHRAKTSLLRLRNENKRRLRTAMISAMIRLLTLQ